MTNLNEYHSSLADQNDFKQDPSILEKYQKASQIVTLTLNHLIHQCQPGTNIATIRNQADLYILDECKKVFTESKSHLDAGLAIPTVICKNNCVGNWSPVENNSTQTASALDQQALEEHSSAMSTIQEGDLIKIEVGVHIDGYISTSALTFVAGIPLSSPTQMITGRKGDVLVAARMIEMHIERLLLPGIDVIPKIYQTINKIAKMYSCTPIQDSTSWQLQRFILQGSKFIPSTIDDSFSRTKQYTISVGDVFAINILISSGSGKAKEDLENCSIYCRNASFDKSRLKLSTSKELINEIDDRFGVFPFCFGLLNTKNKKFALSETLSSGVLLVNPPACEKEGEYVAQIKFTVVIGENGNNIRLSERFPVPLAKSDFVMQENLLD